MLLGVFFGERADGFEEGSGGVVCGGAYCLGAGVGEGVPGAAFDAAGVVPGLGFASSIWAWRVPLVYAASTMM